MTIVSEIDKFQRFWLSDKEHLDFLYPVPSSYTEHAFGFLFPHGQNNVEPKMLSWSLCLNLATMHKR